MKEHNRTDIIQNVNNPLALAIWVYLGSIPDDLHINRSHIRSHFEVSSKKLASALNYLNKVGLIEYIRFKNKEGHFCGVHILANRGTEDEINNQNTNESLTRTSNLSIVRSL